MSVEAALFKALNHLVDGHIYPDVTPQEVSALPRITYQQIGGQALNFLHQTIPDKRNSHFQIVVWANNRQHAAALAAAVEDALRIAPTLHTTVLSAPVAVYEPDTQLYGTRQDFSCWF